MDQNTKLIGIRIMQKRKEKGYTQEALAELLGISSGHLSCVERGCYLPTTQNLFKLCDILGETPNYYLIGELSTKRESNLISLTKMLPESYQKMIEKSIRSLVEAYSNEIENLTNK